MKIAVVAAAGLAVGLLGGTGIAAVKARGEALEAHAQAEAQAQQSQARADSERDRPSSSAGDDGAVAVTLPPETTPPDTAGDPAPGSTGDSADETAMDAKGAAPAGTRDTALAPRDDAPTKVASTAGDSAAAPVASSSATASSGARGATTPKPELDPAGAKKLAKIFGAMKPADAASVLAEMTDAEITAVLLQMNDRLAAPIVGELPPARAAALSQGVLREREGGS
jgi:hypothetical protein